MSSYLSVSGVITRIQPLTGVNSSQYGCTLNMSIRSLQQGEVNFTVTGDTYVVDNTTLHPGDQVTVFTTGMPLRPLYIRRSIKRLSSRSPLITSIILESFIIILSVPTEPSS